MNISSIESALVDTHLPNSLTAETRESQDIIEIDDAGNDSQSMACSPAQVHMISVSSETLLSLVVQIYSNRIMICLSDMSRISNLFLVSHQKSPLESGVSASSLTGTTNLSAITLFGHAKTSDTLEVYAKMIYKHILRAKSPAEERGKRKEEKGKRKKEKGKRKNMVTKGSNQESDRK
jgi:hypothetical protein